MEQVKKNEAAAAAKTLNEALSAPTSIDRTKVNDVSSLVKPKRKLEEVAPVVVEEKKQKVEEPAAEVKEDEKKDEMNVEATA